MEIGLIVAIIILLLGLIFILLLYKEAKNNVVIIENEKEEMCKKMTDTIQEKDSEILSLKSEKDNLEDKIEEEKKEFEKRLEEAGQKQANLVGKTIVDNEFLNEKERLLEEKDRIIREKDNKLKENQQITIELVKDMHELEDKFIENGGDLSELYSDYNEYYQ